jgi:membrane protease YdiL (CAAX protease family)
VHEVWAVFAVSLGASALSALISFVGAETAPVPLSRQQAVVVGTLAPGRPWLDLAYQLVNIAIAVAPVLLVAFVLHRDGETFGDIGLDRSRPAADAATGAAFAAVIGGAGIGLYVLAYRLGISLNVVAADLPAVWWRVPVLVLSAVHNGLLEEVLVVGYLLRRLRQIGWSDNRALLTSAVLRGTYHLYQGVGGFAGNAVMGLIFGRFYQRWGRTLPLIIAHSLIDTGAFLGYVYLHGHVHWLP